jgi:hypothetical protein
VSATNHCESCAITHQAQLREVTGDPAFAASVAENYYTASLTKRERAIANFAVKITLYGLGTVETRFRLGSHYEFALVFEIKLRNDPEYLNSSQYREDVDQGFTQECCHLTFYPREEPVQPEVLRMDAWASPPYLFSRYTPLNPTYPLVLDDEPTEVLRW